MNLKPSCRLSLLAALSAIVLTIGGGVAQADWDDFSYWNNGYRNFYDGYYDDDDSADWYYDSYDRGRYYSPNLYDGYGYYNNAYGRYGWGNRYYNSGYGYYPNSGYDYSGYNFRNRAFRDGVYGNNLFGRSGIYAGFGFGGY